MVSGGNHHIDLPGNDSAGWAVAASKTPLATVPGLKVWIPSEKEKEISELVISVSGWLTGNAAASVKYPVTALHHLRLEGGSAP